ncbi:hypothetical protein DFQ27_007453 [Actinomortierella ambigua]|uniref:Ribosomal protein L17 n=1 Tax=Actinomortierella ambigua TaxID=1343610 RepID=A0A9P6TZ17_9FUNG|nr:hypothetical protein DFQ27_007453 [Actinomortierella ambigua]
MHHGKHFRRLNRTMSHRKSMFRNLATQLIQHDRIKTTLPKAKELKSIADQASPLFYLMITLGKRGDLHAKNQAASFLREHPVTLPKLFGPLAERFKKRKGGYTRIHKMGNRFGDNAPVAVIELVDAPGDIKNHMLFKALARGEEQQPGTIANIVKGQSAFLKNKSLERHVAKVMKSNHWEISDLEAQVRKLKLDGSLDRETPVFDATTTSEQNIKA